MTGYSLNEIESHARRAARGAGMSWGLAEEAGKATRWLAARGQPGPMLLAGLLAANDARGYHDIAPDTGSMPWRAPGGPLCPVCAGVACSDRAGVLAAESALELADTRLPLLLAPFLSAAAASGGAGFELAWSGACVRVAPDLLQIRSGSQDALCTPVVTRVVLRRCPPPLEGIGARIGAVTVDPASWQTLAAFAQRTYVPASEASRSRGAGAGTSDND